MIECVRRTSRNVERWQSGDMALRWTATGKLEAQQQFRRVIGYHDLANVAVAIERALTANTISCPTRRTGRYARQSLTVNTGTAVAKFHDERDILSPNTCGKPVIRLQTC